MFDLVLWDVAAFPHVTPMQSLFTTCCRISGSTSPSPLATFWSSSRVRRRLTLHAENSEMNRESSELFKIFKMSVYQPVYQHTSLAYDGIWEVLAINSRGRSRKCSCSFHCRNSSSSQGQVLHERMQKLEAMSPPPLIILPVWSSNWNGQQFCSWRCVRHPSLSFPRVTILALVLVVQVCSDKWFQLRFPTIHHVKLCEAWAAKIQKALIYDMMLDARETCERHLLRCTVHCLRRCRPWSLSVLAEIANAYIAKEIHTTTIAVLQCYERQISTKCSFMFCL